MAATVRASYYNSTGPTAASAETGIKFNRDDTQVGTTAPIPKPTATGTNYSYAKWLALEVTGTDATTSISNRRVSIASSPSTGLTIWAKTGGSATYTQSTAVLAADNTSTNDATPSGYTAVTTSTYQYDNTSVSCSSAGKNGNYIPVGLGVSNLYVGGAGSNISLPNIILTYDES